MPPEPPADDALKDQLAEYGGFPFEMDAYTRVLPTFEVLTEDGLIDSDMGV